MEYQKLSHIVKFAKEYGHNQIRDAGISDTEHRICTFLYFHSEVSQDTVASALMMDKTTVAKALLSLEKKGYITRQRDLQNRRKNILCITEEGSKTIADISDIYDRWLEGVISCLSEREQNKFFEYCERILENAKKISEESKHEQL